MLTTVVEIAVYWVDLGVRASLYGGIAFVAVLILSFLLRRRGPAVHVALWSLVFVRLILPPDFAHPLSAGAAIDSVLGPRFSVLRLGGTSAHEGVGSELTEGAESPADSATAPAIPWQVTFAGFWLVGFASVLVCNRRRRYVFVSAIKGASVNRDHRVLLLAERWRRLLGIRRKVTVVSSDTHLPPFTIGVLRPVIFLPTALIEDHESQESVIAHEMAHVARYDALWLRLQHLVQALYFFHPLVWISGARLDQEREKLCDATVVSAGRLPARQYLRGLLDVVRLDLPGAGAPTMTARKRRIGVRIQNIIDREGRRGPRLATAVAAAMTLGAFFLPAGSGSADVPPSAETIEGQRTSSASDSSASSDFVNPLPGGRVTRSWGSGYLDPFSGKPVFHRGIDVAAKAGTPVIGAADGVVVVATADYEPEPGAGTVVIIDHLNGMSTYYGHLASFEVENGQHVEKGDVIASVGSTGKSTGPHLHFEIRSDGEALDPANFVDAWK